MIAAMIRMLSTAAAVALAAPAFAQTADPGGAPALKANVTVQNEIVRIGDLVENAGAVADVPIFRAPDLGQTGSVPASRVADAVRDHHIIALDTRGLGEVMVTRASRAITGSEIEARLLRALAGQYGLAEAKDLAVTFDNPVRTLHVEPGAGGELAVARISYEPRTRRFDVSFDLPGSGAARRSPLRFTGVLTETKETAVLIHALAQNEIVKASDIAIERRPKAEVTSAITSIEDLQGLAARHPLRPGIVRQADVMKPELVGRNETVTISYEVPGILVTVRGKALEPGSRGDIINVLNAQTNRTIQAAVTAPGRVNVAAPTQRVVAAAPVFAESSNRRRAE